MSSDLEIKCTCPGLNLGPQTTGLARLANLRPSAPCVKPKAGGLDYGGRLGAAERFARTAAVGSEAIEKNPMTSYGTAF